jgi:integrase
VFALVAFTAFAKLGISSPPLAQGTDMTGRRRGLTDKMIATLPRRAKRYIVTDPEMRGHYVRVPTKGPVVFAAVARGPIGKQVWATLGSATELTIDQARDCAREAIRRIKTGKPAIEAPKPKSESVAAVANSWLARHVEKNKLRTGYELRRIVERYILPHWGNRDFIDIKRSDIARLLDVVEDENGAAMADSVLKTLRAVATWVQSRDDGYVPPFTRRMQRVPKQARERSKVLNDDELRKIWRATQGGGKFGAFVHLLLLTAQRREKLLTLRWDDIDANGVWTIRTEEREKGNAGALQLPKVALDIIEAQPRFVGNRYVFPGKGDKAWLMNSRLKRQLDADCDVTGWRLHDLRRTARSLMARAGVQSEHAERVLGHAIGGVEGIYNRHSYDAEKGHALRELAALIERIVNPHAANVVTMTSQAIPD